jgi:hypothetical protein
MSYGRILKPRWYTCVPMHLRLRGALPMWIVSANRVLTGYSAHDLIDGDPLNRVAFDTSSAVTTHVVIAFDLQHTAHTIDSLCILQHNIKAANGKLRLAHHTSAFTGAGQGTDITTDLLAKVGSIDESNIVEQNGEFVATLDTPVAGKRYWAIEIEDNSDFSATNLEIGAILLGGTWTAPYAPDLAVTRGIEVGVNFATTVGGRRHATADWITGQETHTLPFGRPFRASQVSEASNAHAGRRTWSMRLSRLADTVLDRSDAAIGMSQVLEWRSLLSRVGVTALPFVWTPDSESSTRGDYAFAQFSSIGDETQIAPMVWSVNIGIEEAF